MARTLTKYPDIVGTAEVLKMCDFSHARLYQLRDEGRFPKPYVVLKCGMIWLRTDIYAFLDKYDRKRGSANTNKSRSEAISAPS